MHRIFPARPYAQIPITNACLISDRCITACCRLGCSSPPDAGHMDKDDVMARYLPRLCVLPSMRLGILVLTVASLIQLSRFSATNSMNPLKDCISSLWDAMDVIKKMYRDGKQQIDDPQGKKSHTSGSRSPEPGHIMHWCDHGRLSRR
jgi:hypothetical protein